MSYYLAWVYQLDGGSVDAPIIGLNNISFTAVPEPSTYTALAGALVLGLSLIRRRRKA